MSRILQYIIMSCLAGGLCLNSRADEERRKEYEKDKQTLMEKQIRSLDRALNFYGKLVDQNGHPVERATVHYNIEYFIPLPPFFTGIKRFETLTDESGCFSITNLIGSNLYINEMEKPGYETHFAHRNLKLKSSDSSRVNPEIFTIRKKGPVAFLLYHRSARISVPLITSGAYSEYDLVEESLINENTLGAWANKKPVCDLTMHASYDPPTKNWIITLTPKGTNCGIIFSDQNLYESPENGYAPKVEFVARDNQLPDGKWKYIYMRSRNPSIYSKIQIDHFNLGEEEAELSLQSYINPYEDRNLEPLVDADARVKIKLQEEARKALGAGRTPERRDIEQMTRELTGKTP